MKWKKEEIDKAVGLLKEGNSYDQISEALVGRNREAVKRKLLHMGLNYTMYGGKPEELPKGKKRCGNCKIVKSVDEFNKTKSRKDGLQPWCKKCTRERNNFLYNESDKTKHRENVKRGNKKRRLENRKKAYDYLSVHPCIDCGESDPIVLDFDHRDGVDKFSDISNMLKSSYAWKTIQKEINKCDVRCSNCHRRRTAKQFGWYKFLNDEFESLQAH